MEPFCVVVGIFIVIYKILLTILLNNAESHTDIQPVHEIYINLIHTTIRHRKKWNDLNHSYYFNLQIKYDAKL